MASIQLRSLIDSVLNDTSRDMREQADVVESQFGRRISEMSDSKQKMVSNLREVRMILKVLTTVFFLISHSDVESHCRHRSEN